MHECCFAFVIALCLCPQHAYELIFRVPEINVYVYVLWHCPSWARAGRKKIMCLLHYPRKIKFIHSFSLSLSLSLSLCMCNISRTGPSKARAGFKKTLCLLHYPRVRSFMHSLAPSASPPPPSPPSSLPSFLTATV